MGHLLKLCLNRACCGHKKTTPNKQGIQWRRGCAQRVHAKDHYRRKIMYTWKEVNQQESLLLYKEDLIQVWLPKRQNLLI
jgi:hypothetical protein